MPYTFYVATHALYHDTDAPVVALQIGEVGFWPVHTRAMRTGWYDEVHIVPVPPIG